MTLLEARQRILRLQQPIVSISDVATLLDITRSYASTVLRRLEGHGAATYLAGGKWMMAESVDRLEIPEHLTSPAPSYVSLQTALFYHGFIEQIPETTYAVSIAKTRKFSTPLGVVSVHHIGPEFFFGYEPYGTRSVKMAVPEKALLDVLYLSPARSRLFSKLPEIELPSSFNVKSAREMIARIPFESRRTHVRTRFEEVVRRALARSAS